MPSPPTVSRGGGGPSGEVGIDYLAVRVRAWPHEVREVMADHLGSPWGQWEARAGHSGRGTVSVGPYASCISRGPGSDTTRLDLKGQACGAIGAEQVLGLVMRLRSRFGDCSARRIDLAWDDYERRHSPAQLQKKLLVETAGREGRMARRWRDGVHTCAKSHCFYSSGGPEGVVGESLYLGTLSSGRCLAIYDKAAQSGGAIDAIRSEFRAQGHWADPVLDELLKRPRDLGAVWAEQVVAFIDVKVPASYSAKHPDRRKRASWWQKIVGNAGRSGVRPRRPPISVRQIESAKTQVARRVALLAEAGVDMEDVLRRGREKLTPEDLEDARWYREGL